MSGVRCASLVVAIIAGTSATLAFGCSDKGTKDPGAPTAANPATVNIALVLSTSGALQADGIEAQAGAEVAAQQINALGGVLGKQINLQFTDDTSDPATTLKVVTQMQAAGTVFGIGPTGSPNAEQLRSLITGNQILYISPSAASPDLDTFEFGPLLADGGLPTSAAAGSSYGVLYRTISTDAFQAAAIAQYTSTVVGGARTCANISIVYQDDDYGDPIFAGISNFYKNLVATSVIGSYKLASTVQDDATYTGFARQLATARGGSQNVLTDCQVVIAQPAIAAAYMRNYVNEVVGTSTSPADTAVTSARASGDGGAPLPIQTIGSDGLRDQSFIINGRANTADTTSPTAGEGATVIAAQTADPTRAEYNSFIDFFQAQYPTDLPPVNGDPGRYGSTAYDAVVVLALAMQYAGSTTDVVAIGKALNNVVDLGAGIPTFTPDKVAEAFTTTLPGGTPVEYSGASGPLTFLSSGTVQSDYGVWKITSGAFVQQATIPASVLAAALNE